MRKIHTTLAIKKNCKCHKTNYLYAILLLPKNIKSAPMNKRYRELPFSCKACSYSRPCSNKYSTHNSQTFDESDLKGYTTEKFCWNVSMPRFSNFSYTHFWRVTLQDDNNSINVKINVKLLIKHVLNHFTF